MDKSLELKIEQMKCLSNIQHELLKTFYDGRPITERYLDGSIAIHAHIITSENSLCVTWVNGESNGMFNSRKGFVFVRVREVSDEFSPVTSIVRLQTLDHCNVLGDKSFEMPQVLPELLWRIYNNKLRILYDCLGIETCQLIDKVPQRFSQGLYNFPNEPTSFQRGRVVNRKASGANRHQQMLPIDFDEPYLVLQKNNIGYFFSEGVNLRFKQIQVFPCPVNLLISAIEFMHMLYYPYGEDYGEKETKDSKGARDTRAHKG